LNHPRRVDYEYERAGTACIFIYVYRTIDWLNIAENELSSMTRQCLKDRKMTDIDMLKTETSA